MKKNLKRPWGFLIRYPCKQGRITVMDDAVSTPMQSGGVHEEQDASASKGVEEEDMDLD